MSADTTATPATPLDGPARHVLVAVAWPYANGSLHLGHLAGAYLPADVFARYHRLRGDRVLMVSGTDAHGTPITVRADKEGITPREVVERYHPEFLRYWQELGISFDLFTSTMTDNHHEVTREMFQALRERGYLEIRTTEQFYDTEVERFLPDRYVEGTCPYCGYREARGDQCDNCGRWYEAYQLIDPYSKTTGGPAEPRETTHLYLDLPKFSDRLKDWVSAKENWRVSVKNFILGIIEDGLRERPITRDISWGVPIPEPGFEDKRFYVWFDAPIGYVSSTMEWAERIGDPDRWREYWQDPDTKLVHFIGKDNTVFHAVVWPAMLLGTAEDGEEPYVLPYEVSANEFMNLEVVIDGERRAMQMSTSRNLAVWLHEALDRFPADVLRFYLASILPETGDVSFSWRDLQARVNADLIGNLANYVNRTLSFAEKHLDGYLPRPEALSGEALRVMEDFREIERRYEARMLATRPRDALGELVAMGRRANQFFDSEAPWKSRKEDPERARASLYACSVLLGSIAYHAAPYVPEAVERLQAYLSGPISPIPESVPGGLPDEYRVSGTEPLFRRVEDAEVEAAEQPLARAATGDTPG